MKNPIFLDTSCFTYLFEKNQKYFEYLQSIFSMMSFDKANSVTSIVTVTEVLTKPFKTNDEEYVEKYLEAFSEIPNLEIINPDYKIGVDAAKIRALYNLNLPDAYQVAVAISSGCRTFLTNDKGLKRIKEIEVLILDDLVSK